MHSGLYNIERAVAVSPSQLEPNDWNPNRMKKRVQEALRESLDWVGQVEEILVRPHPENPETYQIINGEHRWIEMQNEPVIYVNVIHGLSNAEAKKLTVVLDSTRGEMDKVDLSRLLADIQDSMQTDTITALPFNQIELEELLKLSEANWDDYKEGSSFQEILANHNDRQQEKQAQQNGYSSNEGGIRSTFERQESFSEEFKESGEYISVFFKATSENMEIIKQAYQLVQQGIELDENPALAWGQVLTEIAREYLGHPGN